MGNSWVAGGAFSIERNIASGISFKGDFEKIIKIDDVANKILTARLLGFLVESG